MWVRKRIEIGPRHLFKALVRCFWPGRREDLEHQIAQIWKPDDTLVFLSVRSGFDLILQSSQWEEGSEVIMSGLTIPDMSRIVAENNLVPVGVDVDLETMAPKIDEIASRINSKTRAIVVAHLFGGLCDMSPIIELARKHNLLVIEDCAQAYVGNDYQGDERADVSMFSFGPIKTNTTLGGALIRIRDAELLDRVKGRHSQWPVQTRFAFMRRVVKYAMVKLLSTRIVSGLVAGALRLIGRNHDSLATTMARGFAGPRFFDRIRHQPSIPLLYMLRDKLRDFDSRKIVQRQKLGNFFVDSCNVHIVGGQIIRPTYWVMPILVKNGQKLVEKLWREGFDATTNCSLVSIVSNRDLARNEKNGKPRQVNSDLVLENIIFVPFDVRMPKQEVARMAKIINDFQPVDPTEIPITEKSSSTPAQSNGTVLPDATVVSR